MDASPRRRGVLVLVAATSLVGLAVVGARRQRTWGACREEAGQPLAGDDLLVAATQRTRAITVEASSSTVWGWLVQLGADRGGFYSYDWLEDHFGFLLGAPANLGIHSADRIVPEWQQREVGDLVAADAQGLGGWYVVEVLPQHHMVLQMADVKQGRPTRIDEAPFMEYTWAFVLRELPDGATRLLVRERVKVKAGGPLRTLASQVFDLVSFVMTRRMLIGIKERAERA